MIHNSTIGDYISLKKYYEGIKGFIKESADSLTHRQQRDLWDERKRVLGVIERIEKNDKSYSTKKYYSKVNIVKTVFE